MDAPEDAVDSKLYRASGDLLPEIQAKLPHLVWHRRQGQPVTVRSRVLLSKTEELVRLLERFQEWPQLLDGYLAAFLQQLNDAFLSYLATKSDLYVRDSSNSSHGAVPLPRAVCRILYVFCKVRGQKVIVRFLNNEAKYIDPILLSLYKWNISEDSENASKTSGMTWEERYILLLWLSHLMLAPFDLASISSASLNTFSNNVFPVFDKLPPIATSLLEIAYQYLYASSKEREAASAMIVRLILRADMQAKQLLSKVVDFTLAGLLQEGGTGNVSSYKFVGLLSVLSGLQNVGSDEDVAPYVPRIFQACFTLATSNSAHAKLVRNSAPVRKLLIKNMRLSTLHGLSLSEKGSHLIRVDDLDPMLEESIQHLLDSLSDKDTPVRMIASKSLSIITLSLDSAMSAEVIEAVLESFNENILLEDPSGRTFAINEVGIGTSNIYLKNLSAVDPLKWQGLMLTLGHLLFRRSPPATQLSTIIAALISGLEFEQRSNVGTSVGVGVRDAACFGIWSLVRKYSTDEIGLVRVSDILHSLQGGGAVHSATNSPLQLLASQLVLAACLDPSGNIRRGSSAALQELIGRHPDTILHGIPLVQAVDYHAVARRSKAVTDVSLLAASLDPIYQTALLDALLGWRGARAADADSRRWTAESAGGLLGLCSELEAESRCRDLAIQAAKLRPSNAGSNAGIRHGLLLCLAAHIEALLNRKGNTAELAVTFQSIITQIDALTGGLKGRVTRDLEFVFEAIAVLISKLSECYARIERGDLSVSPAEAGSAQTAVMARFLPILERCITSSEKDIVVEKSTQALYNLFRELPGAEQTTLLKRWLITDQSMKPEYRCRGRIEALGSIFSLLPSDGSEDFRSLALLHLEVLVQGSWPIETKVHAMTALTKVITSASSHTSIESNLTKSQLSSLARVLHIGLTDYTIDQRGDIGSTLRLKSIESVEAFLALPRNPSDIDMIIPLLQTTAKLAGEKLDKVRFRAWSLLQGYWKEHERSDFPRLPKTFMHLADISSPAYYHQLLWLFRVPWLRESVLLGVISSAAAGTEDIGRASRSALVEFILYERPSETTGFIYSCLVDHLEKISGGDDRDVVPAMELLAFLLEQGLLQYLDIPVKEDGLTIWHVMQRAQTPSSTIQRTEVAIKVYSALYHSARSKLALDKLTRLLLHRYPKVRGDAADSLHLCTGNQDLVTCDWTTSVAALKPVVVKLRKDLGVVQ